MLKSIKILIFIFLHLFTTTFTFQIQSQFQPLLAPIPPQKFVHVYPSSLSAQKQGNITQQMKQTIKVLIDNSTQLYRRYRLTDMAVYISKGMVAKYGDIWQVFVFGEGTENCSFSSGTVNLDQWAVWSDYGIYSLCYVMFRTKSCIKAIPQIIMSASHNLNANTNVNHNPKYKDTKTNIPQGQQQWGYSITDPQKQRIIALVNEASSYGGADMNKNAMYLAPRLGNGWSAVIGGPSNSAGWSTCYFRGYYAYLVDYTELLWSYILIREY